ncbi:hypothetical protein [Bacillus safensis]|uniref:hypothetical protein n=1 Tax=Bacillus safensis TaxID=561879 RepID=UPI0004624F39|nr:hypothetical protein [Bacillus safensis]
MGIREWFGMSPYSEKTTSQCALDRVLTLYREALVRYLAVPDCGNVDDLIASVKRTNKKSSDVLFLDWLAEKGLPKLRDSNFNNIADQRKFISMINVDEFVLQNEMDFSEPNEVRGCIISFLSDLKRYSIITGGETDDQSDH